MTKLEERKENRVLPRVRECFLDVHAVWSRKERQRLNKQTVLDEIQIATLYNIKKSETKKISDFDMVNQ